MSSDRRARPTAATADRHALYAAAVQAPARDAAMLVRTYRRVTGRELRLLREDFCGTAAIACAFVRRHAANRAVGVDHDTATLAWARAHHLAGLPRPAQRARVCLVEADVRAVLRPRAELIAALNFSYSVFHDRDDLVAYLRHCRRALTPGGLVVVDTFGGGLVLRACSDRHRHAGFDHVWEQRSFDPITHRIDCRIHFSFRDGSELRDAFRYDWRLWSLPELRDALTEAGFHDVHVLWQDADRRTGQGRGTFRPRARAPDDPVWLAYVVGRRA